MRTRVVTKRPDGGAPLYEWGGPPPEIMQGMVAEAADRFHPLREHFESSHFGLDALTPRFSSVYGHSPLSPLQTGLLSFIITTQKGYAQTFEDLLKPAALFSQTSIVNKLNETGSYIPVRIVDPNPENKGQFEKLPRHVGYEKEPIRQSDIAQHFRKLEEKGAIRFVRREGQQKLFCVSPFYAMWYTLRQQGCSNETAQAALSYSLSELKQKMLSIDPKYPGLISPDPAH